jgi:hypothetical protein
MTMITTRQSLIGKLIDSRISKTNTKKNSIKVRVIKRKWTLGEASYILLKIPNGLMFLHLPRTQTTMITTRLTLIIKLMDSKLGKTNIKRSSIKERVIKRKSMLGEALNTSHRTLSGSISHPFLNFIEEIEICFYTNKTQ